MKIHLALVPGPQAEWEGEDYLCRVREVVSGPGREQFAAKHSLTDDPAAADAILVLEPQLFKTRAYAERLLQSEAIARFPQKCFTINYDDAPVPYFRGLYAALPRRYFDSRRHRSFCYVFPPHRQCYALEDKRVRAPTLLFSFRGALTHTCRTRMMQHASTWMQHYPCRLTHTTNFYNHAAADQAQFAEELIDSAFVLCPRGLGCSSHRLFETMQMGRVPVIVSDAWIEPIGPRWSDFSLRVPEAAVDTIPQLITQAAPRAQQMGSLARKTWEDHYSDATRFRSIADQLEELAAVPSDEAAFRRRWMKSSFYAANHGTLLERVVRRTKRLLRLR